MTENSGAVKGNSGYAGIDARIAASGSTSIWVGDKIRLRGWEPADVTYEVQHDDSTEQRCGWKVFPPRSSVAHKADNEQASQATPEGDALQVRLVIARRTDDQIVGFINTHSIEQVNGTFMFGVAVSAEHKGHGYAAEAVLLLMRYRMRASAPGFSPVV